MNDLQEDCLYQMMSILFLTINDLILNNCEDLSRFY
jgi:hypothetical protein